MRKNTESFNDEMNQKINILPKVILIVFLLFIRLVAQEDVIHISHLTTEDGLSLSQVTQIYQDNKGFMWIGTFSGLNRYDGNNVKIYLPEPGNPGSISSHYITSIFQDSKGVFWIGTNNGLNRFDPKTETFKKYLHIPNNSNSISHNLVYSIMEDRSGTLWIGTHNALNKYDRENDNFSQLKIKRDYRPTSSSTSINAESICSMLQDYKGNFWLGTWDGLVNIETNGKIIHQFFDEAGKGGNIRQKSISAIYEDKSKFIWVGTNGNGLYKYDPVTGKFTHYLSSNGDPGTISNDYINTIFQDNFNNLWIGTKNGLNKYDSQNNQFKRIFNDPEKPLSIINNEITCITQDRSGLVWVGSFGGVSRFYKSSNKFSNFQKNKHNTNVSLSNNKVNSVFVDKKQNIWVGTLEGLDKIVSDKSHVIHFRQDPRNKNSISDNFVSTVIEDHLGYMWIGTNQNGLNRINPSTGENKIFLHQNDDPASLSNAGITDILEDHRGTIWVGTWYGLNRFNRSSETYLRYEYIPGDQKSLRNNIVWDIFEDSRHMLWVGTDGGGVCVMDPKISVFTNYMNDSTNSNALSDNRVFVIAESKDGLIWFGTFNGLNSFDWRTGKFTVYKKENGLPGNIIFGIEEDNQGLLWISTDKGISSFDRKTATFTNYSKKDGLKELEFTARASAKTKDGKLYFGSKAGVMFFDPNEIKDKSSKAPIVFTDLKIYNQSVPISQNNNSILNESITISKSITFPSGSDVITIDFALLYFLNVRGNTYQYKLLGFEKNWNDVGRRNSATYTNLSPGEYTFLVKASNTDGVKGEKTATLQIIIVPVFYQKWWFKIVLALGIFVLVILFFQQRTFKIKRQNKLLESYVTERTKDLDKTITELNLEVVERKKAEGHLS